MFILSSATAACRNGASTHAGTPPDSRDARSDAGVRTGARHYPPKLARDANDALACRSDTDCVITCRADGDCCLEQCGCSAPMSRAFLARLQEYLANECGPDPLCPVAGCVGIKRYEAYCESGRCAGRKVKGEE